MSEKQTLVQNIPNLPDKRNGAFRHLFSVYFINWIIYIPYITKFFSYHKFLGYHILEYTKFLPYHKFLGCHIFLNTQKSFYTTSSLDAKILFLPQIPFTISIIYFMTAQINFMIPHILHFIKSQIIYSCNIMLKTKVFIMCSINFIISLIHFSFFHKFFLWLQEIVSWFHQFILWPN